MKQIQHHFITHRKKTRGYLSFSYNKILIGILFTLCIPTVLLAKNSSETMDFNDWIQNIGQTAPISNTIEKTNTTTIKNTDKNYQQSTKSSQKKEKSKKNHPQKAKTIEEIRSGRIISINSTDNKELKKTFEKHQATQTKAGGLFGKSFWKTDKALAIDSTGALVINITLSSTGNESTGDINTGVQAEVLLESNTIFLTTEAKSYTGIIAPPTIQTNPTITGFEIATTIEVGNSGQTILLSTSDGTTGYATITIKTPDIPVNETVTVFSSEDGQIWTEFTGTIVQDINGFPSVQFTTPHFTYFAVGYLNWDNNAQFLSPAFRAQNPSDSQIIRALFGNGSVGTEKTAYTRYWNTTNCNTASISILRRDPGVDTIADDSLGSMSSNTIYILESGDYIQDIHLMSFNGDSCSAVIGKGKVRIYTTDQFSPLQLQNSSRIIIDNIEIDNQNNGYGSNHTANSEGIYLNNSTNTTIHNTKSSLANKGISIYFTTTTYAYVYISDSILQGNTHGISLNYSEVTLLNNNKFYNNTYGIYANRYSYPSIYNNIFVGNTTNTYTINYSSNFGMISNITSNSRGTRQAQPSYNPYHSYYPSNYGVQPSDYNFYEEVGDREVWTQLSRTTNPPASTTINTFTGAVNIKKRSLQNLGFQYTTGNTSTGLIVDSSLLVMYNFDNITELGENTSTIYNIGPTSRYYNRYLRNLTSYTYDNGLCTATNNQCANKYGGSCLGFIPYSDTILGNSCYYNSDCSSYGGNTCIASDGQQYNGDSNNWCDINNVNSCGAAPAYCGFEREECQGDIYTCQTNGYCEGLGEVDCINEMSTYTCGRDSDTQTCAPFDPCGMNDETSCGNTSACYRNYYDACYNTYSDANSCNSEPQCTRYVEGNCKNDIPGTCHNIIQQQNGYCQITKNAATQTSAGKRNGAYQFNHSNDYLFTTDNIGSYFPTTEISVSFWLYVNNVNYQTAFNITPDITSNRFNFHPCGGVNRGYATYWDFGDAGGAGRLSYANPADCAGGRHHYTLISSVSQNKMEVWRDGSLEANKSGAGTFTQRRGSLKIGDFAGKIDEFKIYSRALSPFEIKTLYSSNINKYNTGNWLFTFAPYGLPDGLQTYRINSYETIARNITIDATQHISFQPPTPANGASLSDNKINGTITTDQEDITNFKITYDQGSDYFIYDPSLVLMMNMDNVAGLGESNTIVKDVSSHNNHGTASSLAYWIREGKFNGGFNFDGTYANSPYPAFLNAYINIGDSTDFEGLQDCTISARFKFSDKSDTIGGGDIISKYGAGSLGREWIFNVNTGAIIASFFTTETTAISANISTSITKNIRHHVIARRSADSITMYLDGFALGTNAGLSTAATQTSNAQAPVLIGARRASSYNYEASFPGQIDEVRFYRRALSDKEIQLLYTSNLKKTDLKEWIFGFNLNNLRNGYHTFQGSIINSLGATYSTETRGVTINDTTPPTITITDDFSESPVLTDSISAKRDNATIRKRTLGPVCDINSYDYIGDILINDEIDNGYFGCFYGEDINGNSTTISTTNPQNIDRSISLSFTDDVEAGPVASDTVTASWGDSLQQRWTYNPTATCPTTEASYTVGDFPSLITTTANNGSYICLYGRDALGNIATAVSTNPINILTDTTPPVTTIADTNSNPRNSAISTTLSCTDDNAGCMGTFYEILAGDTACSFPSGSPGALGMGGSEGYIQGNTINITDEGTRTVCFYSIDNAGNWEDPVSQLYSIDYNQAPNGSNQSVSPNAGWFTAGSRTFTSVHSDPNGATDINYVHLLINYSIDGGNQAFYGYYVRASNSCYMYGSNTNRARNPAPYDGIPWIRLDSCSSTVDTNNTNNLIVTWNTVIKAGFDKDVVNEYLYTVDNASVVYGWAGPYGRIGIDSTPPTATTIQTPTTPTNNASIGINITVQDPLAGIQSILYNGTTTLFSNLVTMINPLTWTVGTYDSQAGFSANGQAGENQIIEKLNPRNKTAPVWATLGNDSTSNEDGGWNGDQIAIDNTKTYRVSVWIRREDVGNGTTYFGTYRGQVANLGDGSSNGNPYFWAGKFPANWANNWILFVAYIHPSDYSSTDTDSRSGMYDINGNKIGSIATDFKRVPGATVGSLRTYLFYSTTTTEKQFRYEPRFEELNGSEPSIADLTVGKGLQTTQTTYTATANGVYGFQIKDMANNIYNITNIVNNIDTTTPGLAYVSPTPENNAVLTSTNTITGVIDITENNLTDFTRGWNGKSTILYDSSLIAMYNFDETKIADSQNDFGTQGTNNWYYFSSIEGTDIYIPLNTYDGTYWRDTSRYPWLTSIQTHPGDTASDGSTKGDSVRAWKSPITGRIKVHTTISDGDAGGANGIIYQIYRNTDIFLNNAYNNQFSDINDTYISVSKGDMIYMRINKNGNYYNDTTNFHAEIFLEPETDLSIYGNTTTNNGATYTTDGRWNGAYTFGDNQYLQLNPGIISSSTPSFSISTWIKTSNGGIIIGNHRGGYTRESFQLSTSEFIVNQNNNNSQRNILAFNNINDGYRHHIVAVSDNTNKLMNVYIDGQLFASQYNEYIPRNSPIGPKIGAMRNMESDIVSELNGSLDDIRIYNRALSASEVQSLYHSSLTKTYANTWQFIGGYNALTDGIYTFNASASDSLNTDASLPTRTVTIDTTIPEITENYVPNPGETRANNPIFYGTWSISEGIISQLNRNRGGTDYNIYDDSLVAMYNFEDITSLGEITDTLVKDFSNYGNDATVNGATWTNNGKWGGAYSFNGSNYINTNYNGGDQNNWTMSARIYDTKNNNSYRSIIQTNRNTDDALYIYPNNTLGFWPCHNNTSTATKIPVNTLTHITATYNSSIGFTYYINGVQVETEGTCADATDRDFLRIGGYDTTDGEARQGTIDEVRIYNRALSANEIQVLYTTNLAKYDTNLWYFDVDSSNIADGTYSYGVNLTDKAGRTASRGPQTITYTTDSTPPVTSDNANPGWIKATSTTITLTPNEASSTRYCTDTSATCTPETPGTSVSLSCADATTCTQYVSYYSRDAFNNTESVKTATVKMDNQGPNITLDSCPSTLTNNTEYSITVTATDIGIGTNRVQFPSWTNANGQDDLGYRRDGAPYQGTPNGNQWTYVVRKSDHNGEDGVYNTHIYAFDNLGNIASNACPTVTIDTTSPSFTFIPRGDYLEGESIDILIESVTEETSGLPTEAYSFSENGIIRTNRSDISEYYTGDIGDGPATRTFRAKVRDNAGNIQTGTQDISVYNMLPSASNFTLTESLGNSPASDDWYILGGVRDYDNPHRPITAWTAGTGTQGKGMCSINGHQISYTPFANKEGDDYCEVEVIDGEDDGFGNFFTPMTVAINGIDTLAPTGAPSCTPNQFFSSSMSIACTPGAGGDSIYYTTDGSTPTTLSSLWTSNINITSTTTLKTISCDTNLNCNPTVTSTTYTQDITAPTTDIPDKDSNRRGTNITNLTITTSDAGGVGGTTTYYTLLSNPEISCEGQSYTPYTSPISKNIDPGTSRQGTLCYYAIDSLGNTETKNKQIYRIDKTNPTISAPTIRNGYSVGNYFRGTIDLASDIADTDAGIKDNSCQVNLGGRTSSTQTTNQCQHNSYAPGNNFSIQFAVEDKVNNLTQSNVSSFIYDNTIPVIGTPNITAGNRYSNYFNGTISISVPVSDAGVGLNTSSCQYTLDNETSRHNGTFEGSNSAGNCLITNTTPTTDIVLKTQVGDLLELYARSVATTYTYDATAPSTSDNASSTPTAADQTITLTAADAGVGVNAIYYCSVPTGSSCTPAAVTTETNYQTGETCAADTECTRTIRYYTTDKLGNTETITEKTITIDKKAPSNPTEFSCTIDTIDANNLKINTLNPTIVCTWNPGVDLGAGLDNYQIVIQKGSNGPRPESPIINETENNITISTSHLTDDGDYIYRIRSFKDNVGNENGSFFLGGNFTIDTLAPTLSQITAIPNYTSDTSPDYTFSSTEAGTISLGGGCSTSTSTINAGNTTITLNTLSENTYACVITITDGAGNTANLTIPTFTVDATSPTLAYTSPTPADNEILTTTNAITGAIDITENNLTNFTRGWNGLQTALYDSGLLLMYNFDNDTNFGESETSIKDFSIYNNTGTNNGASYITEGKHNGAYSFDGGTDYIGGGNLGTLPTQGTISFWMNPSVVENYRNALTTNYLGGNDGIRFEENSAGTFGVVIGDNQSNYLGYAYLTNGLEANKRYHVTLTWNTQTNTVIGYRNGGEKFSETHTIRPTSLPALAIGNGFNPERYWKGSIDDVRIYNRALSTSEVQTLYYTNLTKTSANTWTFIGGYNSLTDGIYRFNASASDSINTDTSLPTRTVTIDTTTPEIEANLVPAEAETKVNDPTFYGNWNIYEGIISGFTRTRGANNYSIYDDSLVAMYNFDNVAVLGETSDIIKDLSNYGNEATINGATFTSNGKWGGAYSFDGNSISIADSTSLDTPDAMTISFWISPNNAGGYILSKGVGDSDESLRVWLAANTIYFDYGNGSQYIQTNSINIPSDGTRSFITLSVAKGQAGKIYVNGTEVSSYSHQETAPNPLIPNTYPLVIGDSRLGSDPFNGRLDELRIYNRALSADEIKVLYATNLSKYDPNNRTFSVNYNGLPNTILDGTYNYGIHLTDKASRTADRIQTITYSSDITPPTLSASNSSNTRTGNIIPITLTATDNINLANAKYIRDSTDYQNGTEYTNGTTITLTTEGTHTLYLWARDAAGNTNTRNGTYKLDMTPPTLPASFSCTIGGSDANNLSISTLSPTLVCTRGASTDTHTTISDYEIIVTKASDQGNNIYTHSGIGMTTTYSFSISLGEKTAYNYYIRAKDEVGNRNVDYLLGGTFTVDSTPPDVGQVYISSGTTTTTSGINYYKGSISLSTSAFDTGDINTCEYTTNTTNWLSAQYNSLTHICYIENITPNTNITANIRATDTAGNIGTGISRSYIYDATAPSTPTLLSPKDAIILDTNTTTLTWSGSTETGAGLSGYIYQVSTVSDFSTLTINGITTNTGIIINSLGNQTYYWRIIAADKLNNTSTSATRTFTPVIDTKAPETIFTGTTPADGKIQNSNLIHVQAELKAVNIESFDWNWDGVSNNIYHRTGIILRENMDNISALGESEGIIKDAGPNKFTSTSHGYTTSNNAKYGNSYALLNAGGYITLLEAADAAIIPQSFSISLWFYKSTAGSTSYDSTQTIISRNCTDYRCIKTPAPGYGGTLNVQYSPGKSMTLNNFLGGWFHITAVRDYSTNTFSFYEEETLLQTGSLTAFANTLQPIWLGGDPGVANNTLVGAFDEPRIFSYPLSAEEVKTLNNSYLTKINTGTWIFDIYHNNLTEKAYSFSANIKNTLNDTGLSETRTVIINKENNLKITKTNTPTHGYLNDYITYTININNAENFVGDNIIVSDLLQSGLQLSGGYNTQGIGSPIFTTTPTATGTLLEWSGFSLNPGATGSIVFTAQIINSFSNSFIAFSNGLSGHAYNFQNTSAQVDLGLGNDFYINTGDFFVSAWVKINSRSTSIYQRYGGGGNAGQRGAVSLSISAAGKANVGIRDNADTIGQSIEGNFVISTGERHHIAGGRDMTNNKVKIYVDGQLDTSMNLNETNAITAWNNAHALILGNNSQVYALGYYDKMPTDSEAFEIYQKGFITKGLKAFYKMDEGAGSIAYDSYGTNNGTINLSYVSHVLTNQYSFQANLGRNVGNGSNGAAAGILIPRDELYTGYDVLGNKLLNIGFGAYGVSNIINMRAHNGDIFDTSTALFIYDLKTDLSIDNVSVTGSYISGGTIKYTIDYSNTGMDQVQATITNTLSSGQTGVLGTTRQKTGSNDYFTTLILPARTTGSLILTATIITGAEGGYLLSNDVKISTTAAEINTGNNSGNVSFSTLDTLAPVVTFTGSTPATGATLTGNTFTGQIQIVDKNTATLIWTRNGTDYTIYTPLSGEIHTASGVFDFSISSGIVTNTWTLTIIPKCLYDGIYTGTLTAIDQRGNSNTITRRWNIALPLMDYGTPQLAMPNITINTTTITKDFTGDTEYFWINDTKGRTGWTTTLQLSGNLVGQKDKSNIIASGNILFKAKSEVVDFLNNKSVVNSSTSNVHLANNSTGYQALSSPIPYIIKDAGPNCSSCVLGKYGNLPSLKISIPTRQNPDNYKAEIVFTIFPQEFSQ